MSHIDHEYAKALRHIIINGETKKDRTGTGTKSLFGMTIQTNLEIHGFPLITTKYVHFKSVLIELLWFIRGDSNTKYLKDNNVSIWDEWTYEDGTIGPGYPKQWRNWTDQHGMVHDQLQNAIDQIINNPDSRRIIVNSWNVGELSEMALPPCHYSFQFIN